MTDKISRLGDTGARIVLIQPVSGHELNSIENEIGLIRKMSETEFGFIALRTDDWNAELSPWEAPAVFGDEGFAGGAKATLDEIMRLISDTDKDKICIIGGYSLAGLFALWAAYQTDVFAGVAAASPSVWFPGFSDHIRDRNTACRSVYLSLGDREDKTRNPQMASVGDRIREISRILSDQGISTTLEWNPGNHFKDVELRTAKAFAWVINSITREE